MTVGIRELKNKLSEYVRAAQRGKSIAVTSHGRVVAKLVPPQATATKRKKRRLSRWEQLIADGKVRPALEDGDPFEGEDLTPVLRPGEGLAILDWLRGDR